VPRSPISEAGTRGGPLFSPLLRATFVKRPNRFVIHCLREGDLVEAYLPNPGRLWELLLPGSLVYLVKKSPGAGGRLAYMAVAVEREGQPVLLHTHLANGVAAQLLTEQKIPGLEDAVLERAEVTVGRSRFDFLLQKGKRPFYLEVKSCTLFGRRIAMFPDAVTLRGKRHLEELAAMSRQGIACGILFLVHWPRADFFLPDYHTDLDFALTFQKTRNDLFIKALSLEWRADLSLGESVREVCIPWETIARESRDRGSYLLLLQLDEGVQITVGSLGVRHFPKGYYLYVGTAGRALAKRLARHLRKNKTAHWHIDYLRQYAQKCTALAIRASIPLEHELAAAVKKIADGAIPSFGASDCRCESHLFHFTDNPLRRPPFIELLQYFRLDRLEKDLY